MSSRSPSSEPRCSFPNPEYIGCWRLWAVSLSENCPWGRDIPSLRVMLPCWDHSAATIWSFGSLKAWPLSLAWDNFQGPSWSQSSPYWSLGVTAPEFNFPLQNHAPVTPWYVFYLWGCANKSPVCKSQCLHSGNLTEDSLHIYFLVGQFERFKLITAYHLRFSIYLVWNEGEIHQVKGKIRNSIFSQGRWPNSEKEKCTICNTYKRRNTGGCPLFFWASDAYRNLKGKG